MYFCDRDPAFSRVCVWQTRLEMQKALEQDSSVYDYDGVYDDIQKQRLESSKKMLGGTDRKVQQIQNNPQPPPTFSNLL